MTEPPLLRAEGLVRIYRTGRGLFARGTQVRAVDGVSLVLARGRTLGLVGESGSGKSTTGRLILGLEVPDIGRVTVDGAPMPRIGSTAWRRARARMQMVYQDPLAALDRRLPVAAQVREPLDIHRIGDAAARANRTEDLLATVGLAGYGPRLPHELSGGQRQRAVIARSLATRPDLLVCDEPVAALDVSVQAQVLNLLLDIQTELGLAMLFICHDLRVVRQVSHRVAVMYAGRIVEEDEAECLLAAPRHPYTQALVSAAPGAGRSRNRIVLAGEPPDPAARPPGCAFHPRCPAALPRCRTEAPDLRPAGTGHVACHLVHDRPPQGGLLRLVAA